MANLKAPLRMVRVWTGFLCPIGTSIQTRWLESSWKLANVKINCLVLTHINVTGFSSFPYETCSCIKMMQKRGKTAKKAYFDPQTGCAALVCWLKHTTLKVLGPILKCKLEMRVKWCVCVCDLGRKCVLEGEREREL